MVSEDRATRQEVTSYLSGMDGNEEGGAFTMSAWPLANVGRLRAHGALNTQIHCRRGTSNLSCHVIANQFELSPHATQPCRYDTSAHLFFLDSCAGSTPSSLVFSLNDLTALYPS